MIKYWQAVATADIGVKAINLANSRVGQNIASQDGWVTAFPTRNF